MTDKQFCAVLVFGFLLGMLVTDICWFVQVEGYAARLSPLHEPASAGEARPVTSL